MSGTERHRNSGTPFSFTFFRAAGTPALRKYFCAMTSEATWLHEAGTSTLSNLKTIVPSGLRISEDVCVNSRAAYASFPALVKERSIFISNLPRVRSFLYRRAFGLRRLFVPVSDVREQRNSVRGPVAQASRSPLGERVFGVSHPCADATRCCGFLTGQHNLKQFALGRQRTFLHFCEVFLVDRSRFWGMRFLVRKL